MKANQARFPVATSCRVLGVSSSGYYAWLNRKPSSRAEANAKLIERIRYHHRRSRGIYGSPRIHQDLVRDDGLHVGLNRVARLMRLAGVVGVTRRKSVRTTRSTADERSPDLVQRDFSAERPDALWVADITYVPTAEGFLYLASVMDVFSRRIVGWSMANHMRKELVLDALDMAIARRQPRGVVFHSDHGGQYTSLAFGKRCSAFGIQQSMGSVGDCFDNAMAESLFATLECELIARSELRTRREARSRIFEYIEGFYNPRRRHSALGYLAPAAFEEQATRLGVAAD